MVSFKLFGLLTIFMAFAVNQVHANMQCKGTHMKSNKDGLLCGGQYVPYDAYMCGDICSCVGSTLKCSPPSDCGVAPGEWNSVEDFCSIGPNHDWTCQCPKKQEDTEERIVVRPPYTTMLGQQVTPLGQTIHPWEAWTMHTISNTAHKTVTLAKSTPILDDRTLPPISHRSSKLFPSDHLPFHSPQIFPTHATTMLTSIVPKNADICTFRLGNGGCDDDFPTEVVVSQKGRCISATNGFGFSSYSYEVTECSNAFEICYLFDDDVCNGGTLEKALTFKNYNDQKCFPKAGGDGFAIGSIYCP